MEGKDKKNVVEVDPGLGVETCFQNHKVSSSFDKGLPHSFENATTCFVWDLRVDAAVNEICQ